MKTAAFSTEQATTLDPMDAEEGAMVELSLFGPSLCTSYLGYVCTCLHPLPSPMYVQRSVGWSVSQVNHTFT